MKNHQKPMIFAVFGPVTTSKDFMICSLWSEKSGVSKYTRTFGHPEPYVRTWVELYIRSKVQRMFCFKICIPEGGEEEKRGSANLKIKQEEPLNPEITPTLTKILLQLSMFDGKCVDVLHHPISTWALIARPFALERPLPTFVLHSFISREPLFFFFVSLSAALLSWIWISPPISLSGALQIRRRRRRRAAPFDAPYGRNHKLGGRPDRPAFPLQHPSFDLDLII